MEILDRIEEARKEFIDKVNEILPDGYDESQVYVTVDLHDREFNVDLVRNVSWINKKLGTTKWLESSDSWCNKVTAFYDKGGEEI